MYFRCKSRQSKLPEKGPDYIKGILKIEESIFREGVGPIIYLCYS